MASKTRVRLAMSLRFRRRPHYSTAAQIQTAIPHLRVKRDASVEERGQIPIAIAFVPPRWRPAKYGTRHRIVIVDTTATQRVDDDKVCSFSMGTNQVVTDSVAADTARPEK